MDDGDLILVPGATSLQRTWGVEAVPADLPLEAHASRSSLLRIGAFTGFGGVACFIAAGMSGAQLAQGQLGATPLILLAICLITGTSFLNVTVACAAETRRRMPAIVITAAGLSDHRIGVSLAWSSVASVRSLRARGGVAALRLKLKTPIAARRVLFGPGSVGLFSRRRRDEVHIAVVALDVPPRVLAEAVMGLIRRRGGTVEPCSMLW